MADPAWMTVARALIGTRETPGAGNSPVIMKMAAGLGAKLMGIAYAGDHVPWCGLFVAHCVNSVGIKPAPIAVRASAWAKWGAEFTPRVGAVLVFDRDGGGHVAFYEAEDENHYQVLGGNQGDAVKLMWIEKDRLVKGACRWPLGVPVITKRNIIARNGGAVSRNEA